MATFADDMVEKYERLLRANAGLKSVSVDGVQTTFDDLTKQWEYWRRVQANEAGTGKPRLSVIDMSGNA